MDLVFAWKETTIGQDTDDIVKNSLFILIRISDKLFALSLIESKKNFSLVKSCLIRDLFAVCRNILAKDVVAICKSKRGF